MAVKDLSVSVRGLPRAFLTTDILVGQNFIIIKYFIDLIFITSPE